MLFAVLALDLARRSTCTIDEFADIPAGLAMWRERDFAMDARNPPVLKLVAGLPAHVLGATLPPPAFRPPAVGWWPWLHGTRFLRDNEASYDRLVLLARAGVIALAVALGALLWMRARQLHGEGGGLLSLALFALSPMLLAHGSLATTDLGAALFFFAACVAADRHLASRSGASLLLAGALAGAALATKFSTVLLFPGLSAAFLWAERRGGWAGLGSALGRILALSMAALLVLQAAYFFPGGVWLQEPGFELRSGLFAILRDRLPDLPLPLPPDFVRGFDDALAYARDPELPGYLDGEWSKAGFWRYHLEAFARKEPLAVLLLLAVALGTRGRAPASGRPCGAALVLPPLLLLASLLTWNRVQYGLRYALPLYPFLFLWAGRAARPPLGSVRRWLVPAGLVFLGLSVLRIHPHELSYFNRLGGGPEHGFRHLSDSNLDWGQDLGALAERLRTRYPGRRVKLAYFGHVDPAHYGIDYEVLRGREDAHGLVAVSASYLAGEPYAITWRGLVPEPVPGGAHTWLGTRQPIDRVGYSIYLYDLP